MDFLAVLRHQLTAFGELVTPDVELSTPVTGCGDWTLYDLADHVGNGNLWVVTAVAENRGDHTGEPAPKTAAELRAWLDDTADALVTSLSVDPETPAWTFSKLLPRTVGFWQRRRALETLVHVWDGQHALGAAEAFDPELAADGISEVFELFAPRMIQRGLATEPQAALRIRSTDTGQTWTYGPGEPVAELTGAASDLLLALWQRIPATDPALAWNGNWAAGERILAGPLVP
ncbi:maleylpyruvate isomerase family mycothiol-dependent enzyme [Nocardia sp. NPDC088792]|uniref:maleylpyruvate isomerase family mycothiol-dependent enzyme n=1 Tax=Nocardia sp. NPDC088792 TaxID=3364332 RepID=UPI0037F7BD83